MDKQIKTDFAFIDIEMPGVNGLSAVSYTHLLITGIYFGFGDMSRYIQSIGIFMNCSLKISIFEYLILWILEAF